MFNDHYPTWNNKRLNVLLKYYDKDYFSGKTVLEVGCGHAFFSKKMLEYGATPTASDARKEYLNLPVGISTIAHDLDEEWVLGKYDVVFHFGVLYHLRDPKKALINAIENSNLLFLETEVLSSMDDKVIFRDEKGYDQAFNGVGNQLSVGSIEQILINSGKKFVRVDDPDLNCFSHHYDWEVVEDSSWKTGRRKFWIVGE